MRVVLRVVLTALAVTTWTLSACSHGGGAPPLALQVATLVPTPEATGMARSPVVEVTFNDDVDAASVATDQIEVRTAAGPLAGTITVDGPRRLRFATTATLPFGTVVSARLRNGVHSRGGTTIAADLDWRFRVVDPLPRDHQLPVASAGANSRSIVTAADASDRYVIAVGADIWVVPGVPGWDSSPPDHEAFPFAPGLIAVSNDGALAGATLVDRGTLVPDHFLVMAVRHADGTWQNEDLRVLSGVSAGLVGIAGGHGGAFVSTLSRGGIAQQRFVVGPRTVPPTLAVFDNGNVLMPMIVVALDLDTAVVCQGDSLGQAAVFTRYQLATAAPTATATWQHRFGLLAADRDGNLLVLSKNDSELTLERLRADGTVAASATVRVPPITTLNDWRILPGTGTAAAIGAAFGTCMSFRLDASEAPQLRTFVLPQDAIDTAAWDACYVPSGDLRVVVRLRLTAASEGSLVAWRQRPGRDWEGSELIPQVAGRPLGRPGIAADEDGLALIAVPRAAPDQVVLFQDDMVLLAPAPR